MSGGYVSNALPTPLFQEVATLSFNSGVTGAFSAWQQVLGSLLRNAYFIEASISFAFGISASLVTVEYGIGAAAAEVTIGSYKGSGIASIDANIYSSLKLFIASGTRLAVRAKGSSGNAVTVDMDVNVLER